MSRYLAIDYGEKRVGLAVSDPTLTIAQPLETLGFRTVKELMAMIRERTVRLDITRIILGLPLSLKGTDSEKTKEVRLFGKTLADFLTIPVDLFDERLTTVQAHHLLKQVGKKPSRNRDKIDQIAAVYLLQAYLDKTKRDTIQ